MQRYVAEPPKPFGVKMPCARRRLRECEISVVMHLIEFLDLGVPPILHFEDRIIGICRSYDPRLLDLVLRCGYNPVL